MASLYVWTGPRKVTWCVDRLWPTSLQAQPLPPSLCPQEIQVAGPLLLCRSGCIMAILIGIYVAPMPWCLTSLPTTGTSCRPSVFYPSIQRPPIFFKCLPGSLRHILVSRARGDLTQTSTSPLIMPNKGGYSVPCFLYSREAKPLNLCGPLGNWLRFLKRGFSETDRLIRLAGSSCPRYHFSLLA